MLIPCFIADLTDLLSFSQHKFVASLFDGSSAKKASRQFSTTVTARFKKQLRELVNRLERYEVQGNLTRTFNAILVVHSMFKLHFWPT